MSENIEKLRGIAEMRTWIAGCGPLALVRIRHHMLVQQQANSPLPNRKKFELLTPSDRARLEGAIAVERTIYRGIESRYDLSRAEDRDAAVGGLMHGLRFDDLRITDESIERCVDNDQWSIDGCEYFEYREGAWSELDEAIRGAAFGKADEGDDVTVFFPVPLRPANAPPLPSPRGYVGDLLSHLEQAGLVRTPEASGLMTVIVHGQRGAAGLTVDTAGDAKAMAELIAARGGWTIPGDRPELMPFLLLVMWPNGPGVAPAYKEQLQYERS